MKVTITEKETGKAVIDYTIYSPGDPKEAFINEAWRCAVEDDHVNANEQEKYDFHLEEA